MKQLHHLGDHFHASWQWHITKCDEETVTRHFQTPDPRHLSQCTGLLACDTKELNCTKTLRSNGTMMNDALRSWSEFRHETKLARYTSTRMTNASLVQACHDTKPLIPRRDDTPGSRAGELCSGTNPPGSPSPFFRPQHANFKDDESCEHHKRNNANMNNDTKIVAGREDFQLNFAMNS